ncbi:hypothetical protein D3C79_947300 [compost metagenome]
MIAAKVPLRLTGTGNPVQYSASRSTAPRLIQHLAVSSGDKYRMLASPSQQVQCLVEHAPADLQGNAAQLLLILKTVNAADQLELCSICTVRGNHEILVLVEQQLIRCRNFSRGFNIAL